ncbi:MAG: glycosyltransferase family 2 protein [Saccharofermentanales bacterium]
MDIAGFHFYHLIILFFSFILCSFGLILFSRNCLEDSGSTADADRRVSVIIPARNEENNLPHLLASLMGQTYKPYEILVVDDGSSDRTAEIARGYGVTLVANPELPEGWTGKNWAVWNGYLQATGDIFVFLDSDIRLAPRGLELLLKNRARTGGVISVLPYHYNEKFFEKLSLVPYILGVFAFTAPAERAKKARPLYGSCIVATRADYEQVSGHKNVRHELLDDMSLGKAFSLAGIRVETFSGCDMVSFRMYPDGLKSELQGFSKGAVGGMETLRGPTVAMIACWVAGLILFGLGLPVVLFTLNVPMIITFAIGYLLYTGQLYYLCAYSGRYGVVMPLLHFLSTIFFIVVMLYSMYRTSVHQNVIWKGRLVAVVKKARTGKASEK